LGENVSTEEKGVVRGQGSQAAKPAKEHEKEEEEEESEDGMMEGVDSGAS
jgi:hypothetical protein